MDGVQICPSKFDRLGKISISGLTYNTQAMDSKEMEQNMGKVITEEERSIPLE
jgi:hypothetical protein